MENLVDCKIALSSKKQVQDHLNGLKDALIMMVDDEPILMEIVQAYLEDTGYHNFITIDQPAQALEALKHERPDVILLDLNMPEINGFELLTAIRANRETQHLPAIMLTSASDTKSKLTALELGATDFLAKPVDPSELVLRLRNILSVKAYQDQLAFFDTVTGLPNRNLFLDRLGRAIQLAQRENKLLSVLNIGIDRFRHINDSLGPKAGDSLLRQVAKRLTQIIRQSDIIGVQIMQPAESLARLGGDEFSVVIFDSHRAENAALVARRILDSLRRSFRLSGQDIFITCSIGIAVYPDNGDKTDLLIKHAAIATIHAKYRGRNNFQFYSDSINSQSRQRLNLETRLRRALENEEFELYYQPKIAIDKDRVVGMEALLRWKSPTMGLVSPDKFIPLAEETGLIVPIGEWVINEACRQNMEWQKNGAEKLKVSVNVSPQQFRNQDLHQIIEHALTASAMDPHWLMVEITENIVMDNATKTIELLNKIQRSGVSFSIDDFGTGYSSFSYLKQLPVCELKIDRSFLIDVPEKEEDAAVTKAIIAMAHSLGLSVVAEGVENDQQLNFLRGQGCDLAQGYFFSKPLTAEDFSVFVAERVG